MNTTYQSARDSRVKPRGHRCNLGTCPASGKVRYRDGKEAKAHLRRLTTNARWADEDGGQHTIAQKRAYACNACRGWHLTSWESPAGPSANGGGDLVGGAARSPAGTRLLDPLRLALAESWSQTQLGLTAAATDLAA